MLSLGSGLNQHLIDASPTAVPPKDCECKDAAECPCTYGYNLATKAMMCSSPFLEQLSDLQETKSSLSACAAGTGRQGTFSSEVSVLWPFKQSEMRESLLESKRVLEGLEAQSKQLVVGGELPKGGKVQVRVTVKFVCSVCGVFCVCQCVCGCGCVYVYMFVQKSVRTCDVFPVKGFSCKIPVMIDLD